MIRSIAWKNIWRSKLRSMVVILAVGFGLLAGIFSVALMNGMILQRLSSAINIEVGSMQLHNSKYLENSEPQFTIPETDKIIENIKQNEAVAAVAKHYKMECMLSSNRAATGLNLVGINPEEEKMVSQLYQFIADSNGTYLTNEGRNPILISTKTAEKLKIKLRNKIIVNGVKKDGTSTKASFRVVGIYRTSNSMFDQGNAFIRYDDAAKIFGFDANESHEIVILNKEFTETKELKELLQNQYTKYKLNDQALLRARNDSIPLAIYNQLAKAKSDELFTKEAYESKLQEILGKSDFEVYEDNLLQIAESGTSVMTWDESSPDLAMMTTWIDLMLFIFVGIILLALGFGIVNTMLMVVLERTKELGMLMAIGMNRRKVFKMILLETVMLSLTGGVLGMILSLGAIAIFKENGLNLNAFAEGFEGMGYASIIYPTISVINYIEVTLMVVFTGILASIYPARRATKLNPAEAVRSE